MKIREINDILNPGTVVSIHKDNYEIIYEATASDFIEYLDKEVKAMWVTKPQHIHILV